MWKIFPASFSSSIGFFCSNSNKVEQRKQQIKAFHKFSPKPEQGESLNYYSSNLQSTNLKSVPMLESFYYMHYQTFPNVLNGKSWRQGTWVNKYSSIFVDKGTIESQKETGDLRVARNSKSVWFLVLRTDGACRYPQNTEQNLTQRW